MKQSSSIVRAAFAAVLACISLSAAGSPGKKKGAAPPEIMVFAAASLAGVLAEVSDSFTVSTGTVVRLNLGSSGNLARQLEQGGGADVFVSASKVWMTYADSLGLLQTATITTVAGNDLVFIVPADSRITPFTVDSSLPVTSFVGSDRLSIGDPAHVPAGRYAVEALTAFGWYTLLEKNLLPAKDVRSALMAVEMGEAPLGIVYRTDAKASKKVNVVGTFPSSSHKPIVYMAGVCKGSEHGSAYCDYLKSVPVRAIWVRYGFRE